jgi:hypothetical protein
MIEGTCPNPTSCIVHVLYYRKHGTLFITVTGYLYAPCATSEINSIVFSSDNFRAHTQTGKNLDLVADHPPQQRLSSPKTGIAKGDPSWDPDEGDGNI